MYDLIIIGGGAAGLFAAANGGAGKTLLLEKSDSPGKKLLISGGGMCNLTNRDGADDFITRFGDRKKANFLKPSLYRLDPASTIRWFEDRGFKLAFREDGKVFPASLKASELVEFLMTRARAGGVVIRCASAVTALEILPGRFRVSSGKGEWECRNLLIATGGKSFESTGSDGSGYSLAREAGHKIVEPTQALAPLFIDDYPFKDLAGSSLRSVSVGFFHRGENRRYLQSRGDLLFTHKGLSGPVILNNSRFVRSGDQLRISLVEGDNREEVREMLQRLMDSSPGKSLRAVLKEAGLFSALIDMIAREAGIDRSALCSGIGKKKRNRLLTLLSEYTFTVSRKAYFSSAMATAGGVSLDEINRKTMESRLVPGLYFAGEVLDIDGDTGGYNIQAAFSTAFSALSSIGSGDKEV